jgi:hypothetical protein
VADVKVHDGAPVRSLSAARPPGEAGIDTYPPIRQSVRGICRHYAKGEFGMNAINRNHFGLPALAVCLLCFAVPAGAEPLSTAGVGVASCEKLAKDMNPAEGFNNTVNALVYYWVQGYMSAANIALLEGDSQYVDLAKMDEKKLLPMIQDFCRKNPGKKPISLIDQLIEDSDKVEGKWKSGTVPWAADDD